MDKLNIANLARGALVEQAEGEIQKVLENIADPNTDPKKARKVVVTLTFKPQDRESCAIDIQSKSTVVPYNPVATQIYMGRDNSGRVIAAEYIKGTIPGQTMIGEAASDASGEGKVLSMNKK